MPPGLVPPGFVFVKCDSDRPSRSDARWNLLLKFVEEYKGQCIIKTSEVTVIQPNYDIRDSYDGSILYAMRFETIELARKFIDSPEFEDLSHDLLSYGLRGVWVIPGCN